MRAKQKMLKEDWEFFKAQRKLLEDSVLRNKSPTTAHKYVLLMGANIGSCETSLYICSHDGTPFR